MDMAGYKTSLNMKTRYLLGFTVLLFTTAICAAFSLTGNDDFDLARQQVMLRKIGHEVLLHSGDSTSRVLPVKKIAENEYQVRFENEFAFEPDSLVKIISRSLAKDKLAHNYIVTVLKCTGKDVIFGYMISGNRQDNIVPCLGRRQPKSCYLINLKFEGRRITAAQKAYLLGGLPFLAFIGLIFSQSFKTRKNKVTTTFAGVDSFKLGNSIFDPGNRQIIAAGVTTALTVKENKLLLIFARSPNIIIERGRLQKEIWEDEGVIVGRSLDMFISKLRKKLENDSSIQLTNIHGRGYKLEIGE
ncbi:Transcriptional regulatory protein, C terminal [Mucilaginibacter sp. OK283]|nr:Transcriptional regulatory protein, C terminal [Mucilaginibacter sp. OK283]